MLKMYTRLNIILICIKCTFLSASGHVEKPNKYQLKINKLFENVINKLLINLFVLLSFYT